MVDIELIKCNVLVYNYNTLQKQRNRQISLIPGGNSNSKTYNRETIKYFVVLILQMMLIDIVTWISETYFCVDICISV